jgi:hypothetical protein
MRLGLQDTSWSYVGARLAQADDNDQVEFFRAFLKECRSWGTAQQVEMQLAGVNQKLTDDERGALGMLSYKAKP